MNRTHVSAKFEKDDRRFVLALEENESARASFDERFRSKKPTHIKLCVAALELTGWRLTSDGALEHNTSLDRFAVQCEVHAAEVAQERRRAVEAETAAQALAERAKKAERALTAALERLKVLGTVPSRAEARREAEEERRRAEAAAAERAAQLEGQVQQLHEAAMQADKIVAALQSHVGGRQRCYCCSCSCSCYYYATAIATAGQPS